LIAKTILYPRPNSGNIKWENFLMKSFAEMKSF
jgi:hypothetical protein